MSVAVRLIASGRVQGVGFRWFIQRQANELALNGFVRNLPNGDVEIEAVGPPASIDKLIQKTRTGPAFASVAGVGIEWLDSCPEHESFEVAL